MMSFFFGELEKLLNALSSIGYVAIKKLENVLFMEALSCGCWKNLA